MGYLKDVWEVLKGFAPLIFIGFGFMALYGVLKSSFKKLGERKPYFENLYNIMERHNSYEIFVAILVVGTVLNMIFGWV